MVTFLFSVHIVTEARQYAGLGRAKPGRWIFRSGHLIWRALRHCVKALLPRIQFSSEID